MKNYSESRNYNGEFSFAKRLLVKIQLVDKDERIGKRWRLISSRLMKIEVVNFVLTVILFFQLK
jgi:hypothetical protein